MKETNETGTTAWTEIKQMIRSKWGKFSAREIESARYNMDGLVYTLQEVYGFARNRAEREYHEFRVSLGPILQPIVLPPQRRD